MKWRATANTEQPGEYCSQRTSAQEKQRLRKKRNERRKYEKNKWKQLHTAKISRKVYLTGRRKVNMKQQQQLQQELEEHDHL